MFRHSEATNSAKFMTEAQLRKRHGWSPESKMPAKYVHMINADVDAAIFEHLGIETKETEEKNIPKICQICNIPNSSESKICSKCGKPLSLETALEREEQEANSRKQLEDKIKSLEQKQVKLEDSQKEYNDIKPHLDKMLMDYFEELGEDFFKEVFGKKLAKINLKKIMC